MANLKTIGPNLSDDFIPSLGELLFLDDFTIIGTPTATTVRLQLTNGYIVKLSGTSLALDGTEPIGGTLTGVQLLMPNGTTVVHTLTGLGLSFASFGEQVDATDPFNLVLWMLNGNDTITGSDDGSSDMYGGAGNDTFIAGAGGSYIEGGLGSDTYVGGSNFDAVSFADAYFYNSVVSGVTVDLAAGTAIDAFGNKETLSSIEGLRGTQFADIFKGSGADEQFIGLGGRDNIDGAGGFDTIRYDRDDRRGGNLGVTVDLQTGTATDGFGRKDTLANIEGVRGTNQADKLYGSGVYNDLRGFDGDDWLDGRGDGDSMAGGRGNDTYVIDSVNDFVEENRDNGDGIDTVRSSITVNLNDADHFRGDIENVVLLGTAGLTVDGDLLNNVITGNSGANTLRGADGEDTINGGDGADKISGGRGNDKLAGNAGADSYYFGNALSATTNVDTISGFSSIDFIYLSKAIFTKAGPVGTLAASAFASIPSNTSGNTGDASDRIFYQSDTGRILYDPDGSGAAASTVFAVVATGLSLNNADFVIY